MKGFQYWVWVFQCYEGWREEKMPVQKNGLRDQKGNQEHRLM